MNRKDNDVRQLFRRRTNALKTLRDRGFTLPESLDQLSYTDFVKLYQEDRHHIYVPEEASINTPKGVYVYFEQNEEMNKKILESRVGKIGKEYPNLRKLFFVMKMGSGMKKHSMFVRSAIEKEKEYAHVEILDNIYPFDMMKNVVIPLRQRVLSEAEKKDMEEKYGDLTKFPKVGKDDPMAKHYGAKPGDLMEIVRKEGIYYRLVVAHPK